MALFGKLLPAASALLVAAGSLGAQATKSTCDADATKGGLAKAAFNLEQARTQQGTPTVASVLTGTVKQLEAIKGEDPTVQALFMGQALSFWLSQPNMSLTPRRGTLGFTQNPDATIDLVTTVDSLFRIVETAKPGCVELTAAYRGGLPGYLNIVNNAINTMNAEKLDSAEYFATQANRLYAGSPYGAMVLGGIASRRKNDDKALEYWATAAATAAKDTIYRDVQRQMLSNAGSVYLNRANAASGADRLAAGRKAVEIYNQLLTVPGTTGSYLSSTRNALQTAQLLVGDTAAFVASYQPLVANPTSYGYQDLLNSAVNAARANRTADAVKLFEATLAQNPYNRDALFNLALMYVTLEQNEKVAPIVERLVAIDPANTENYNLAARAYLARSKAAQAAKKTPVVAAMNDTTMVWYNRGAKLPAEVVFTEFNSSDKNVVLRGNVTDRRDKVAEAEAQEAKAAPAAKGKAAAKKPAVAAIGAAPVTLKIEALDKTGKVIGTETVTTEPLTPGKTAPFRVTIQAADAAAYRYTLGG
jgi:tetratricopeptide (TPR) repeat protein